MARHATGPRIPRWTVAVPLALMLLLGGAQAWATSRSDPAKPRTSSSSEVLGKATSTPSAAATRPQQQDSNPNSGTPHEPGGNAGLGPGAPGRHGQDPTATNTPEPPAADGTDAKQPPGDRGPGGTHPSDQQKRNNGVGRATAAQPNPNCTLTVPADPLSAAGLATPYRLRASDPTQGGCHEANKQQAAFVEATVLDPATGALSVYHPLVVDDGTVPAAAPTAPTLPAGAVVGVWFGFNGTTLTLGGRVPGCVNGTAGSPFGQFADCGAAAFFTAANRAVAAGTLAVPTVGTGSDGRPCPTTRDFAVVDQDQSDNLATSYRVLGNGRIAQDTAANVGLGGQRLTNASDNGLLDAFIDPALGCRPMTAPDLGDPGKAVPSLALNELQAAAHQGAPVALVPANDPMSQNDGKVNPAKIALYRIGVDQSPTASSDGAAYCRDLVAVAPGRLKADQARFTAAPTPDPAAGTNLFTFLAQRLQASYQNLGCGGTGAPVLPLKVTMKGDLATAATITK